MPPTPNPSTPSYAHDPGDPQHPHTAAQKQGAPSEKEIEGGKLRGTDRDSPALLPPSIRERSRRNPRSCGAAGAAHTPAPGAGNPSSSAAVEAEPEACGRGLGAVAGGEAKAAEGGESGSGAGWRLGREEVVVGSGLIIRPVRSNHRSPVAVYQISLTENRWKPVEFKSKFKIACVIGLDRFTGRFTSRFDRFTKWALIGRLIFFPFLFWFNFKCPKSRLNE